MLRLVTLAAAFLGTEVDTDAAFASGTAGFGFAVAVFFCAAAFLALIAKLLCPGFILFVA